ncbi:MAG: glutathione S-transferase N-terminal domain-containing protein [Candidatus Omnitrophica bacterium]|nr:glutathione S-transferase N-terminal domain-containing protein [Candidatus Omnitrophota bacterium]
MKKVTVYSTPMCGYCIRLKQFLDQKGVEYETIDISKDPSKLQELVKKSGQMGVPVTDIEGKIIVGFDKQEIVEALGI